MICYYDKIDSPIGVVYLAATVEGLVYCSTPTESAERRQEWLAKYLPDYTYQPGSNEHLLAAKEQLAAYFAGEKLELDVPLRLIGTPFRQSVWQALTTIPYGETRTYGEIAKQVGRPRGPRAVGQANNKNPISLFVP